MKKVLAKFQKSTNDRNKRPVWNLKIGYWNLFGIWCLVLGALLLGIVPTAPAQENMFTDNVGIGSTGYGSKLYIKGTNVGFSLRVATSTPADSLVVTGSGNVGIATTAPTQKLEIQGNLLTTQEDAPAIRSYTTQNLNEPSGFHISSKQRYNEYFII